MKEVLASIFLVSGLFIFVLWFICRPLAAIGDIPGRLDKLTAVIKELNETIKNK